MDRFGLDTVLALLVAVWFVVAGLVTLFSRGPAAGRRAVSADPGWLRTLRRVRGGLEVLGGLAVAAGAAISVLGLRLGFPGRAVGLALAALALWAGAESARPPVRWVRLVLAAVGFGLAVFYAGFRG
ncbi:MAG: hypothetical protein QM779_17875 [Propionicimonas sp.]|uniref:hypothetical protein n=1 Tax=Propionicimonas sp. TaxID=1955623 RepID=UPI003D12EEEA